MVRRLRPLWRLRPAVLAQVATLREAAETVRPAHRHKKRTLIGKATLARPAQPVFVHEPGFRGTAGVLSRSFTIFSASTSLSPASRLIECSSVPTGWRRCEDRVHRSPSSGTQPRTQRSACALAARRTRSYSPFIIANTGVRRPSEALGVVKKSHLSQPEASPRRFVMISTRRRSSAGST